MRTLFLCLLLSVLACACGGHPLDGGWRQHTTDGKGVTLQFDPASNALQVHGPERADGSGHDHFAGTYTLAGKNLTVEWKDGAKTTRLTGTLDGDHLHLSGPGFENAEFHHAADPHGHDH